VDMGFELFLVSATLVTGLIALWDKVYLAKRRSGTMSKWVEYAYSFFPVLLIVLLLRSFLVEPFRIPTGSLEPTLLPGDFVAANKFAYGLRLPVLHTKIFSIGEPKTGDIAVLRYPLDPTKNFIKRVIGMPGDKISYSNKILYINDIEQPQRLVGHGIDQEGDYEIPVDIYEENLKGIKHLIYVNPDAPSTDMTRIVPAGEYFMMGDNRDNSEDSRYWGFAPEANFVGKAFLIWFSWDKTAVNIRWHRIGELINHA
jgi:signal peptidase I